MTREISMEPAGPGTYSVLIDGRVYRVTKGAGDELQVNGRTLTVEVLDPRDRRAQRNAGSHRGVQQVAASMPGEMVRYLASSLRLNADDVYTIDGPLNMPDLMALYKLDQPALKDKPLVAAVAPAFRTEESMFDVIKRNDVLVHHPYTSFSSVVDFINTAAYDPNVQAIKMTLYRIGQDSPLIDWLIAPGLFPSRSTEKPPCAAVCQVEGFQSTSPDATVQPSKVCPVV
jgi:polyphosphate kinase